MIERRKVDSGGRRLNKGRRIEDGTDMKRSYILPHYAVTPAPAIPTALTATAVSSSQINLSWVASAGPTLKDYAVYRQGTGLLGFVTATSFSDTGLAASTAYTYFVTARNLGLVESAPSNFASATTQSSSTVTNGQTVTITGGPYGAKSGGLVVDDHGQGTLGAADPQWTWAFGQSANPTYIPFNMVLRAAPFTPVTTVISKPHPFVGGINAGAHFNGGGNLDTDIFLQKQLTLPASPTAGNECIIYSRCYKRGCPETAPIPSPGQNHKFWYYQPAAQQLTSAIVMAYDPTGNGTPSDNTTPSFQCVIGANEPPLIMPASNRDRNNNSNFQGNYPNLYSAAVGWFLEEIELCVSQVAGAGGKGFLKVWANGVQVMNWQERTDNYAGTTRYWGHGCYNVNPRNATNWEMFSDHRIDITGVGVTGAVAKVIWGNTTTLAASTIRAYMNIDSWTNTAITGKFPQDRFTSGQTAHGHVVKEDGTVLDNQGLMVVA